MGKYTLIMTKTVLDGQSWFDLALLYTGNAFNAFLIAFKNGSSIDVDPPAGNEVEIPSGVINNNDIVAELSLEKIPPGTAYKSDETFVFDLTFDYTFA